MRPRVHLGPGSNTLPGFTLALPPLLFALHALPQATLLAVIPPCPFRAATGLLCPGCGATHAVLALLQGDLPTAWHSNPLFLVLLPFALAYAAVALRRSSLPTLPAAITTSILAVAILFTIARNLP